MGGGGEAGVLATGASLGRHLVVELVFNLYLAGLADLGEVQVDDHFFGCAVVNYSGDNFGKRVADLDGEASRFSSLRNSLVSVGFDMVVSPGA